MKRIFLICLVLLLNGELIHAQDTIAKNKNTILTEKFYIYAGVFAPFKEVKFAFSASVPGEDDDIIDLDETLNIDGIQVTFNTNFNWRFAKKWSLNADYFSLRTNNSVVLPKDIKWDKYTIKKGSTIEGGYGASVLKVGFGRIISRGDKHEFQGLIGVYLLGVNGFLSGMGFVDDKEIELERSRVSVTLPLPSIGLSFIYAPTEKLSFFAKGEWFGIKIGDIDGSLWNLSPGANYRFSEYIGASLSYKFLQLFGNVTQEDWNGSFEMQFQGPSLGLTASF